MRQLEIQEMEQIQGGNPFWGTVTTCQDAGTYFDPPSGNYYAQSYICETKYRFWINFGSDCYYAYGSCPASE